MKTLAKIAGSLVGIVLAAFLVSATVGVVYLIVAIQMKPVPAVIAVGVLATDWAVMVMAVIGIHNNRRHRLGEQQ